MNSIKLYEDNQATIKRFLAYRIASQAGPLDILITALCELFLRKTFDMLDTKSNMQLHDLNSNPHGRKVSRISFIVPLEPDYILPQVQNTIKLFA